MDMRLLSEAAQMRVSKKVGEAMSMLSSQIKELREKADMLDGLEGMDNLVRMLREAADTIESLRDSLNEVAGKWAGEMIIAEDYARENMMLKANNGSRWFELFGTHEKAARTITQMQMATDLMGCCDSNTCPAAFEECWKLDSCPMDDYDPLLEWLRGDA